MQSVSNTNILALDVGEHRIGVAMAGSIARLAHPLVTLQRSEKTFEDVQAIIEQEKITTVVIGYPRGMQGQETAQTMAIKAFGRQLEDKLGIPVVWQDETLTSVKAEAELANRRKLPTKGDVDALAAVYILEDYLDTLEGPHA